MRVITLQSGSNGNCIYVESAGVRLLFDAGIPGALAERRLGVFGVDIRKVDGVIISHDHSDHVCHAGSFQRKYGLPLYATPLTLEAAERTHRLGKLSDINLFFSGGRLDFGTVSVETIPTPHDGLDGSAFVVDAGGMRLGLMTDLGHVFDELVDIFPSLDAVVLESNFDSGMLRRGSYPAFLKKRIAGPGGHLSNIEAADLLRTGEKLKWACLAHLSERNNNPDLALGTHRRIVREGLALYAASRRQPTVLPEI
jgi:phosphoribosyl 1,2-cyclic phosphodiesterase